MLAEIDSEKLEDREVLLTTTTLIKAGIESLGGFMAMFALNLADFPEARRARAREPARIPDAIEQSLRYNTSVQRFRPCLAQGTEPHGKQLRTGDFVCLAYGASNRDERVLPNPDMCDIARRPKGHLGFAGGVHSSVGSMVARTALRIILEEWLARMPEFSRIEHSLPWMPSTTLRNPTRLPLTRH